MRITVLLICLWAGMAARADVPRVATDIAPVQSLVARVMQGIGSPDVIVRPGASPHGYALRPSEAAALARADLVIWMGEGLTPWMAGAVDTLAGPARTMELLELPGTTVLPYREGSGFGAHTHAAHEEHEEHDAHDDHDGHDADDNHEGHDGHDAHAAMDPHAWLDPVNAQLWLQAIAEALSDHDPDNAATYRENAREGQAELTALIAEIEQILQGVEGAEFLVFHDGYQYFEVRFDIAATGALATGDAAPPGPARLARLQDLATKTGVTCVLSEPQFNARLVAAVFGEADIVTGVVDPMGARQTPGAALYPEMMRALAAEIAGCAGGG